jgi:cell division protein FtsL
MIKHLSYSVKYTLAFCIFLLFKLTKGEKFLYSTIYALLMTIVFFVVVTVVSKRNTKRENNARKTIL